MASVYSTLAATATSIKETGVSDYFLFASRKDFDTLANPTAPGDTHITADHVFDTGLGFMKVVCAPSKQKLSAQFIGEAGNLKMVKKFEAFIPGSNKEAPEGGWESGTTKEGVKGYKATFEYPTGKVLTYEGAITMHP
jgi:hypothetical protein